MTRNAAWRRSLVLLGPLWCCALAARRRPHHTSWNRKHVQALRADHHSFIGEIDNGTSSEETQLLGSRKPPRIFRTGTDNHQDGDSGIRIGQASCFETLRVTSASDKYARCPADCPFYASDKTDEDHCTFVCVPAEDCTKYNPKAPVADAEDGVCRSPTVNFCEEYELSGLDRCSVCKSGYVLAPDGQCYFKFMLAINILGLVLLVVVLALVAWTINIGLRPIINETGLKDGLSYRSSCKLSQPTQADGSRPRWPLSTNLMTRAEVAGPGMMLHFNFQFNLILWAFGVGLAWVIVSYIQDPIWSRYPDLMRLGTRKMGYPRENCILVAWGYETQQRLMWVKIVFLTVVYLVTFALCIWHSVRQRRLFEEVDAEHSTMTDFAALLQGLPLMSGSEMAEDAIAAAVREQTGQKVIGISIAWDFKDDEEKVVSAAKRIVYEYDALDKATQRGDSGNGAASSGDPISSPGDAVTHTGLQKKLFDCESWLAGESTEEGTTDQNEEDIKHTLEEMKSTEYAFVVFETEDARNTAVDMLEQSGGLELKGAMASIAHVRAEPDTVLWENFGHSDTSQIVARLATGFGLIFLALLLWTVLFYGPYAWSVFQFNYDNGQQPDFKYGLAFSMVVVVGNVIMYEVCARVSDYVGFHFRDNREACYMILYTIATSFNVLLDFVTTYYTVWEVSKGLGFRTYHGQKVKEITSFTEAFETYAMQRQLGENTFTYAFPSTFLIPFLIEPIVTIYLPLKLGVMFVRTHPKISGELAEGFLASAPMDMGRYADCLLNVVLAVLVLYFPGGWTWRLYFAMAMCHGLIYAFDHWKVLQNIPNCTYASMDVDWWSQALLAPCTAGILSCLIFKMNCQDYGFCVDGVPLITVCTLGFFAHCVVHILVLVNIVPMLSAKKVVGIGAATTTFQEMAKHTACSWFTSNPVHCLRSKYKYKHEPECAYYIVGKEHCIQENPAANVYYHGERMEDEDYEESFAQIKELSDSVKDNMVNLLEQIRSPRRTTTASSSGQQGSMPDVSMLTPSAKSKLAAAAGRTRARMATRTSDQMQSSSTGLG